MSFENTELLVTLSVGEIGYILCNLEEFGCTALPIVAQDEITLYTYHTYDFLSEGHPSHAHVTQVPFWKLSDDHFGLLLYR